MARHKIETGSQREYILSKAGKLFWSRGFHRTSIKDIAAACRFEAPNVYNYFSSKEQILYEVMMEDMMELLEVIRHIKEDYSIKATEQLESLIHSWVAILLGYKRSAVLLIDTELQNLKLRHRRELIKLRDEYDQLLQDIIRSGVRTGEFGTKDVKIASYLIASLIARVRVWYSPKGRLSSNEVADFVSEFVLSALRVDVTSKGG